jgi:hypothetical protein
MRRGRRVQPVSVNYLEGLAPCYVDIAGSYRRSLLAGNRSRATIDTAMWALGKLGHYLSQEGEGAFPSLEMGRIKKAHIEGIMGAMLGATGGYTVSKNIKQSVVGY